MGEGDVGLLATFMFENNEFRLNLALYEFNFDPYNTIVTIIKSTFFHTSQKRLVVAKIGI